MHAQTQPELELTQDCRFPTAVPMFVNTVLSVSQRVQRDKHVLSSNSVASKTPVQLPLKYNLTRIEEHSNTTDYIAAKF